MCFKNLVVRMMAVCILVGCVSGTTPSLAAEKKNYTKKGNE